MAAEFSPEGTGSSGRSHAEGERDLSKELPGRDPILAEILEKVQILERLQKSVDDVKADLADLTSDVRRMDARLMTAEARAESVEHRLEIYTTRPGGYTAEQAQRHASGLVGHEPDRRGYYLVGEI